MIKPPELIVGYEQDGVPGSAVCSACGQQMPDPLHGPLSATQRYAWYTSKFEEHVHLHHSPGSHSLDIDGPKRPSAVNLVA